MFPVITHLDQVRAAIEGRPEFVIVEKPEGFFANYAVAYEDTFPPIYDENGDWIEKHAILRECRGIMFDKEGKLISRPFQKFFNMNQMPETQAHLISLDEPHVILDKMDGSMIRPVLIDGNIRLCTKMGITEQSEMVEAWLSPDNCETLDREDNYYAFFEAMVTPGPDGDAFTPIFEFCSRKNQIVIDYPEDMLVLTAIRKNSTGEYVDFRTMSIIAKACRIPVVEQVPLLSCHTAAEVGEAVKPMLDCEGVVIRYPDGRMIKIKAEDYCIKHGAKDSLLLEKNLLKLHLEEKLDDILPLLDANFRARVDDYIACVNDGIAGAEMIVASNAIHAKAHEGRRYQAEYIKANVSPLYQSLVFNALDGKNIRECVVNKIIANTGSSTKVDEVRTLIGGAQWVA